MKNLIRTIQLCVSAAEHEVAGLAIDEARQPDIEAARQQLLMLRGSSIVDALVAARRMGIEIRVDLRPKATPAGDPPPARQSDNPRRALKPAAHS